LDVLFDSFAAQIGIVIEIIPFVSANDGYSFSVGFGSKSPGVIECFKDAHTVMEFVLPGPLHLSRYRVNFASGVFEVLGPGQPAAYGEE
jgi:hypothetical protein